MQTRLLMFIKSLEQILNATYYLAVRLSNFISQPGGRGALSLLSLIFPRFSMPRSQKLDSLGSSRILLWILFRDLTPPAYCWLLWASTGEEINTQHIPAQLSLQSEEDDIQNEVQQQQYCPKAS